MYIVYLAFAISAILVSCSFSDRIASSYVFKFFCGLIAIAIVSVIAGVRNLDVSGGTDVLVYGNPIFDFAANSSTYGEFVNQVQGYNLDIESGYLLINYLVSRFTDNPHVYYGLLSFSISSLIFSAGYLIRKNLSPFIFWSTYLLTIYFETFNLLRQSISMAMILLAVSVLLANPKRKIVSLLIVISAIFFHATAVIGLLIWLIALLLIKSKRKHRVALVVVIGSIILSVSFGTIFQNFSSFFEESKYQVYTSSSYGVGRSLGLGALYRIPFVVLLYLSMRSKRPVQPFANLQFSDSLGEFQNVKSSSSNVGTRIMALIFLVISLIEAILLPIRLISYPLYRIPLYFGFFRPFSYSFIAKRFKDKLNIFPLLILVFDFLYLNLLVFGQTDLQYHSDILSSIISVSI